MHILVLTRYARLGSSSRVRFYQYFPYLRSQGVQITSAPFFDDEYVRRIYSNQPVGFFYVLQAYLKRLLQVVRSSRSDLLWIEKELFPWLPAWAEKILSFFGIRYVVDYDDAVFHRYDMHKSKAMRMLVGHKIDQVMRHAALV